MTKKITFNIPTLLASYFPELTSQDLADPVILVDTDQKADLLKLVLQTASEQQRRNECDLRAFRGDS